MSILKVIKTQQIVISLDFFAKHLFQIPPHFSEILKILTYLSTCKQHLYDFYQKSNNILSKE